MSDVSELRLPSKPQSARTARHFIREVLEGVFDDALDAAELATSEVVTNAVLHAHTELVLRVSRFEGVVRVEVEDFNPTLPAPRPEYGESATTGRGMELVAQLCADCGVRSLPQGKVVWFTVSTSPEPEEELDLDSLLDAWDLDELEAPAADPDRVEVRLRELPPTLWLAAREHHDAALRELVLYLAAHPSPGAPDLSRADAARAVIEVELTAILEAARERGEVRRPLPAGHPSPLPEVPHSVELTLHLDPHLASGFSALQDALDLAERLATAGELLIRPALPEVVALRDWVCEQAVAQCAGVPPLPWPGADQSRFLDKVDLQTNLGWDPEMVLTSERGVVAGDDQNRIIAISKPLADALGWDPVDIVGRRVVALIPPSLREAHVAGFSRHLTTGEAHVLGVPLTLPVLTQTGDEILCEFLVERAPTTTERTVYLAWITPLRT